MPELPDVEGFRRVFAEHATGREIRRVDVLDAGVLRDVSAEALSRTLVGHRFSPPRRHGKWLIAPVGNGHVGHAVLLHFGMTGSLHGAEPGQERHRHDRVIFAFADGELRYRDMRKLQGLRLVDAPRGVDEVLASVGPDATEVSARRLEELLDGRRRRVKATLTDQSIIAGIGNLLADEILWRARIDPHVPCADLNSRDVSYLDTAMQNVLTESIKAGHVPAAKSWLTGRRDDPSGSCPRCRTILSHDRIDGRTTTWCQHCQTRGRL